MTQPNCVVFYNPGLLDPKSFQTFGVNVKPKSASPIGFFGTGLKYAISVLLREGQEIEISSGEEKWFFFTKKETFRGKEFDFIYATQHSGGEHAVPLGITTDLGKNWKLWMAYRELWSNAKDEGGGVRTGAEFLPFPQSGDFTTITVKGSKFLQVHGIKETFLLHSQALWADGAIEVHPGENSSVFYRGIKVAELPKPSLYTYNILTEVELTEDRTLSGLWYFEHYFKYAMKGAKADEGILERVLRAPKDSFEGNLVWQECPQGTPFEKVCAKFAGKHGVINPSAAVSYRMLHKANMELNGAELSEAQSALLAEAVDLATALGFDVAKFPIQVVGSLGAGVLGEAWDEKIILSVLPFDQGLIRLCGTLVEEFIHLEHDLRDGRQMCDFLLDRLITQGQEALRTRSPAGAEG